MFILLLCVCVSFVLPPYPPFLHLQMSNNNGNNNNNNNGGNSNNNGANTTSYGNNLNTSQALVPAAYPSLHGGYGGYGAYNGNATFSAGYGKHLKQ